MSRSVSDHRCVAPDDRGHEQCTSASVTGAPFPLCVHHLAEAWKFANQRMTKARAGRTPSEQRHLPPPPELVVAAQAVAPTKPGTVYYLRVGALIKIGVTWDLDRRLGEYPPDIQVLATEPGGSDLERRRLDQFRRHAAHSKRTEWFHPAPELLAHIETLRPAS